MSLWSNLCFILLERFGTCTIAHMYSVLSEFDLSSISISRCRLLESWKGYLLLYNINKNTTLATQLHPSSVVVVPQGLCCSCKAIPRQKLRSNVVFEDDLRTPLCGCCSRR